MGQELAGLAAKVDSHAELLQQINAKVSEAALALARVEERLKSHGNNSTRVESDVNNLWSYNRKLEDKIISNEARLVKVETAQEEDESRWAIVLRWLAPIIAAGLLGGGISYKTARETALDYLPTPATILGQNPTR